MGRWERGKPAAHDITGTSPLCLALLGEAGQVGGAAALAAETCNWPVFPLPWRHTDVGQAYKLQLTMKCFYNIMLSL